MIKSLRGTVDVLPPDSALWEYVEKNAREVFREYGYESLRTPIFERTELFVRSIGEATDIVEKEMYTFTDRKERSITLRPEGTAGVVRACLQHKLLGQKIQKLYYMGPMFRYERPQAGRQRQFHQIGVELFGSDSPLADAEVIAMMVRFLERIGLKGVAVNLNSLGDAESLENYKDNLRKYFADKVENLCPDCQRRYQKNILRLIDCKVPACRAQVAEGTLPTLKEALSPSALVHYEKVLEILNKLGIDYKEEPKMVRGLDYYTHTIFEVTHNSLGAQDALGGGGRYDNLVESIGGLKCSGIGFAMGLERLIMVLKELDINPCVNQTQAYLVSFDEEAVIENLLFADKLRQAGVKTVCGYQKQSIKSQMRKANSLGAKWVIMRGQEEREKDGYKLKNMQDSTQEFKCASEIIEIMLAHD